MNSKPRMLSHAGGADGDISQTSVLWAETCDTYTILKPDL